MTQKSVGVGLIGFGTVGSGVIEILQKHPSLIESRVGAPCRIMRICDIDIKTPRPGLRISREQLTTDYKKLIADPGIDILVELIGGYEPARTIVCEAMEKGKHIVTANKALLSKHWDEVVSVARKQERLVYFEAAVGGGIPVIQGLNEGLAANHIEKIMGILNGTTNYILTKMADKNMSFDVALAQAQKAGFAEADPQFDINGKDAAHKLSILASIASGAWVKPEQIYCEGITHMQLRDIVFARQYLKLSLKLIGIYKDHAGVTEVRVHPALISNKHPFSSVQNEYNAILINGDAVGDVMFYGKGAGRLAAASAVVSDIIFLARQVANGTAGQIPYVSYDHRQKVSILPIEKVKTKYYLRFTTKDKPGVLSKISGILGKHKVSIASVYQQEFGSHHKAVPIIIVTHEAREGDVSASVRVINGLSFIKSKSVMIRIEE